MTQKTPARMTHAELAAALQAAKNARAVAEYQEGLEAWRAAVEAAERQLRDVQTETDKRLAAISAAGKAANGQ
jgi:hypothetical protein